jgi:Flp pilus assembly protein TadB
MKPIDPAEISALLDGELRPDRAEEVRLAIAEDESLQRLYAQHSALDIDLRTYSQKKMFRPKVLLGEPSPGQTLPIFQMAFILLMVRFVVKFIPSGFGIGLEFVALAIIGGWVLFRLIRESEEERMHLLREIAMS